MSLTQRFGIGTKYRTRGKYGRDCVVIDVLRTYNSADELVKLRYVSTHEFCGQTLTDHDVVDVTISLGLQTLIDPPISSEI